MQGNYTLQHLRYFWPRGPVSPDWQLIAATSAQDSWNPRICGVSPEALRTGREHCRRQGKPLRAIVFERVTRRYPRYRDTAGSPTRSPPGVLPGPSIADLRNPIETHAVGLLFETARLLTSSPHPGRMRASVPASPGPRWPRYTWSMSSSPGASSPEYATARTR